MTSKQAYRPRVGDERWIVRWCIKIGMLDEAHPEYGCDPDANVMRSRLVLTQADAERVAREVYPLDKAGTVAYWPVRFVPYDEEDAGQFPHVGYWEDIGDEEYCYYEGEE